MSGSQISITSVVDIAADTIEIVFVIVPQDANVAPGTTPTRAPTVFTAAMCGTTGVAAVEGSVTLAVFLTLGITVFVCLALCSILEAIQLWLFLGSCGDTMKAKAKQKRRDQRIAKKAIEREHALAAGGGSAGALVVESNPMAAQRSGGGGGGGGGVEMMTQSVAKPPTHLDHGTESL